VVVTDKTKFLTWCGLTCMGGSERKGCPCTHPKDCQMRGHPDFQVRPTSGSGGAPRNEQHAVMKTKFFEIKLPVQVRESSVWRPVPFGEIPPDDKPDENSGDGWLVLTIQVEMGPNAAPEDAVKWLAEKLEEMCNEDTQPYEGD
jgi:hypothetical protein